MPIERSIAIAPSILSADFARLGEDVAAVTQAGADYIHVDVMDGHFVPNLTLGPPVVAAIKASTALPLDVHLMIEAPERSLADYVSAGASLLTVHAEACVHLHRVVQAIRELGASPGVALNPATPIDVLQHVLPDIDLVLIMTVNPGFGGQKPIPAAIRKIQMLRRTVAELVREGALERPPLIEVDGGIKVENAADFAGADVFVSGSGIFKRGIETEGPHPPSFEEKKAVYAKTIQAMRGVLGGLR